MSAPLIGFLGSLAAGIFFALYPVPRRHVKLGINDYMISMTIGVLLVGLLGIVLGIGIGSPSAADLSPRQWLTGILAGSLWCLGTILYVYSVDCIGVGKATPIKNLTAILGIIYGLLIFKEYRGLDLSSGLFLAGGTGLLIATGVFLGGIQGKEDISRPSCPVDIIVPSFLKQTAHTAGWLLALGAALFYSFFSIPVRVLSSTAHNVFQFLPAVGIGALATSIILDRILTDRHTWLSNPLKEHLLALLSGAIWSAAFIGLSTGFKYLGVSLSWPLVNSSTVFSVLYAVLIAREIDFAENRFELIRGILLGIGGITLLGLGM